MSAKERITRELITAHLRSLERKGFVVSSLDPDEPWSTWADKTGEYVGSQKHFSERLESRGITPLRRHDGRGFIGIRLLSYSWDGSP